MTTTFNSLISWPTLLSESTMTVHPGKSSRNKPALIKRITLPAPPDEATIQRLNELAAKHPFCSLHRVKKHDTL
ncbi:hypothetical protein ACQ86N_20545 [Puia sp. P3]|uniref:hypothetical protein n=1 Tax=Puia sp. P3 TaxID=3423952 RepID=UPI003D676979